MKKYEHLKYLNPIPTLISTGDLMGMEILGINKGSTFAYDWNTNVFFQKSNNSGKYRPISDSGLPSVFKGRAAEIAFEYAKENLGYNK
jgi:hypothetical protein